MSLIFKSFIKSRHFLNFSAVFTTAVNSQMVGNHDCDKTVNHPASDTSRQQSEKFKHNKMS